jgi:hypothetical protein
MKSTDWRGIAEIVGVVAIVASLIFVGLQMQQEQQIAIADTYASPAESVGTLADLIGQYPEAWIHGLNGDDMSPEDRLRFQAIVEAVDTHFFNMYLRFYWLEIGDPQVITQSYAYAIYVHPGLRATYEATNRYRRSEDAALDSESSLGPFNSSVDAILARLDQSAPPLPEVKEYVFW